MTAVSAHDLARTRDCSTPGCPHEANSSGLCGSCRPLTKNGKAQVRFEATGLVVDGELSDDDIRALLRRIATMDGALKFWLGDLIAHFDRRFWKRDPVWLAILDELGISYRHARECLAVAKAVPLEARRERLSWSHHRAVAQLEPAEAGALAGPELSGKVYP